MHVVLFPKLLEEWKALWRDIDRRERARREAGEISGEHSSMASVDAMLLERLLQLCQKMSQVRKNELQSQ